MMTSSSSTYTRAQKVLHWSMALLIIFNLLLAEGIEALSDAAETGAAPAFNDVVMGNMHVAAGCAVLLLALVRLYLSLTRGVPTPPPHEPKAARISAFYLLFIIMPATGLATYYAEIEGADYLHGEPLRLAMWSLIFLHLSAIAGHRLVWRTNIIGRMIGSR